MKRNILLIPKAPFARILMNAGATRVSQEAMDELTEVMTEYALTVSKKAAELSVHAGRKTVKAEDVRFAAQ